MGVKIISDFGLLIADFNSQFCQSEIRNLKIK